MQIISSHIGFAARALLILAMMVAMLSSQTNACPYRYEVKQETAGCCTGSKKNDTSEKHCCTGNDLSSSCCCAVFPVIVSAQTVDVSSTYAPFLSPGEESALSLHQSPAVPPPRSL